MYVLFGPKDASLGIALFTFSYRWLPTDDRRLRRLGHYLKSSVVISCSAFDIARLNNILRLTPPYPGTEQTLFPHLNRDPLSGLPLDKHQLQRLHPQRKRIRTPLEQLATILTIRKLDIEA